MDSKVDEIIIKGNYATFYFEEMSSRMLSLLGLSYFVRCRLEFSDLLTLLGFNGKLQHFLALVSG